MNKLKPIEISLAFGVLVALLWGSGTAQAQEQLSDSLVRLHVIANSDSQQDQADKLAVRDAILTLVEAWGEQADSVEEMEEMLSGHLDELEQAGEQALRERECLYDVTASVTNCYFPTKTYEGFSLPAGTYTALRLVIGEGEGANWWCVAFPPLCVGASAKSMEEAAQVGFFTQEQVDLLTQQEGEYILKFRSMELLGQLKSLFFRD